jgi:hypothetical protein
MRQFSVVCIILYSLPFNLISQSVVVNEMSQGSGGGKEWVELLVVDNSVDIRGWQLGDNDDGIWHSIAEFSNHEDWSSVASGTIIVIYNSGDVDATITAAGGEDTDFADKSVIIPVNNSTYVLDIGPWGGTSGAFANTDGDDTAAIRDSNDVIIHDMAISHPTATVSAPGSAKVKSYSGNTTDGISDNTNWIVASSSAGTPGSGNGGDNSTWIDSSLPVELSSWSAYSANGQVKLAWTTVSEYENLGFFINRRQSGVDGLVEVASFVNHTQLQGHGSTAARNNYTYIDKNVDVGKTYYYQLSDVDYKSRVTHHSEIHVTVSTEEQDLKPAIMELYSAYPNPFNPSVKLSFSLRESVDALSLTIFNMQGHHIRTLASGAHPPGNYRYYWNGVDKRGQSKSSGTYVVSLSSGSDMYTQQIILLR